MSETVVVAGTFLLSYAAVAIYAAYLHVRRSRADR